MTYTHVSFAGPQGWEPFLVLGDAMLTPRSRSYYGLRRSLCLEVLSYKLIQVLEYG